MGEGVAGEEKLFHYTGDSPFLSYVPTKPEQIGYWMMSCVSSWQVTVTDHMKMDCGCSKLGISSPVIGIVPDWINIIEIYPDSAPVLFFGCYYNSAEVNQLLKDHNIPFTAASSTNSYKRLCTVLTHLVQTRGQYI